MVADEAAVQRVYNRMRGNRFHERHKSMSCRACEGTLKEAPPHVKYSPVALELSPAHFKSKDHRKKLARIEQGDAC